MDGNKAGLLLGPERVSSERGIFWLLLQLQKCAWHCGDKTRLLHSVGSSCHALETPGEQELCFAQPAKKCAAYVLWAFGGGSTQVIDLLNVALPPLDQLEDPQLL